MDRSTKTRFVIISDTHGLHHKLEVPAGDILIHAGDLTKHGGLEELPDLNTFLGGLPHRHKIIIAGNHDFCYERQPEAARTVIKNAIYLEDELLQIEGIRIYGSPWTPQFFNFAFMKPRGRPLKAVWDRIPDDIDILITHGPPQGIGDLTIDGYQAGCEELRAAVARVQPRLHIFGHIHEGRGIISQGPTTFINASSCDLYNQEVHLPLVFDYEQP